MFKFLKRSEPAAFDIRAIGDNWITRPIVHENRPGELKVRQIPSYIAKSNYKFVALSQPEKPLDRESIELCTAAIQRTLESEAKGLLVVIHREPEQITWYAYSSTRSALDATFSAVRLSFPVRWGINEDLGWAEYEYSRNLAGG